MKALNPGTWMLNCLVNDHYNAGMYALFNVTKCDGKSGHVPAVSGGKTRTYYIAANEMLWNYGPTGMNDMDGESLTKADRYKTILLSGQALSFCWQSGICRESLLIRYLSQSKLLPQIEEC